MWLSALRSEGLVQAVNEAGEPVWTRVYNIPRYQDSGSCRFVRLETANGQQARP